MTTKPKARPKRVYKYRAFSELLVEALVLDQLFFADPSSFNDPLDARPTLEADLPVPELERILRTMVERRVTGEMTANARAIKYRGPRTTEHISKHAGRAADQLLEQIRYNATDPDYEMKDPLHFLLSWHVHEEVLRRYDRGIVSLAKRADCPLMWSHYGDQHAGICIGYSAPDDVDLQPVDYGGSRHMKASLVRDMVDGVEGAESAVDHAVLLKKAKAWSYEQEWRLIGDRGAHDSTLELEEIVFGMRCPSAVRYAVAKALMDRRPKPRFYEIRETSGSFNLRKVDADMDEMLATWPRRSRDARDWFKDIALPDDKAEGEG